MPISRDIVLKILRYLLDNPDFYFPFQIVSKKFEEKYDVNEIEVCEEYFEILMNNSNFCDFELIEDFQNLNLETLQLMSKGFIEKILDESIIDTISTLAKYYRESWKEELWESCDIEEYGLNEFLGGKAEAFEECLALINSHKEVKKFIDRKS